MDITSTYRFLNAFSSPFCPPLSSPSPVLRAPHNSPETPPPFSLSPPLGSDLGCDLGSALGADLEFLLGAALSSPSASPSATMAPASEAGSESSSCAAGLSLGSASGSSQSTGGAGSDGERDALAALAALLAPTASAGSYPMPLFATCNCGNVRLSVRRLPACIVVCQCPACRRFSGGLAAHLASFAAADITLSGALEGHYRGRALREFCGRCGCAVRVALPGCTLLCAGLLPPGAVDNVPWQLGFCGGE